MNSPRRIGIFANLHKPKVWEEVPKYLRWIADRDIEIVIDEAIAKIEKIDGLEYIPLTEAAKRVDLILSFGGDGTLLRCVNEVGNSETPILGINLGSLGYLAELSITELYRHTDTILNCDIPIENRLLLRAIKKDSENKPLLALNDFVFDRGDHSRTIRIRTSIDGIYLNTYTADGIILSTPTGSTGYSLSAGGPILEPTLDALIINPICPHTLAHRPVVVRGDRKLTIETDPGFTANVMVDGEYVDTLEYGQTMEISRAPFAAKLVNFTGKLFYQVLREKLRWGEDSRHPEREN